MPEVAVGGTLQAADTPQLPQSTRPVREPLLWGSLVTIQPPLTAGARVCDRSTTQKKTTRRMAGGECMSGFRNAVPVVLGLGGILAHAPAAWGLPNPSRLRFIGPTPSDGAVVTSGTVSVAVDASCTFDPNSLAVTLNGTTIP